MRKLAALLLAPIVLAGCGAPEQPPSSPAAAGSVTGAVTVFAAASLTETFTQIGKDFEAGHPGVRVRFNFGGSSALAQQISQGAPADVFASASPANMKQVADTGAVTFVRNKPQIAVGKGNPLKIATLADVTKPEVKLALCAQQVPCGAAATKAFEVAKLTPKPVTLEQDVKATLTKVKLGEVDAALVYRTDVSAAADDIDGVDFPEAIQAVNDYPIVTLTNAPNAAGGKAFVDYVLSEKGRQVLTTAGFDAP
ncbi:molybdate ABC transporter substrate-binding protein [Kibdelosporangium persicum]|uniref:Molybdenum ABC transporter, periplasmic molybdenum-binding protein ModA n=1 Tax=Kibdelosporangium persicum TaxID=2698649 RepID=A0ABX2F4Z8_9PSEU|nr:molybdate ABC transporter substrate-binding protein [Kibdelosporangium persicum]NRN65987.1 Molybdenum ABC transporter, periplasmic molybdenum-binding protein ModA [Kibdelosporangium persicum]